MEPTVQGDGKHSKRCPGQRVSGVVITQVIADHGYDGRPEEGQTSKFRIRKEYHCYQTEVQGGMIAGK